MTAILIIDDEQPVREVLRIALSDKGHRVLEAANGAEGLRLFQAERPDIVITDVMMPGMDGLEVTRRIKEEREDVDIIIMTGYGSEELVIEALRSGASNYLKKPIAFNDLFAIVDKIVIKRQYRKRFEISRDVVFYEQKHLVLGNDLAQVWGAVNQILYNIHPEAPQKVVEGMRIGLYEMIVNAIEHGNLGIISAQKSEAILSSGYARLLAECRKRADELGKKVFINCTYTRDRISVEIRDQGEGFDFRNLPDMSDPNVIMSVNGRGIFLASLYFDRVSFQDPGNSVMLEKNL
jgi:YesN/AraC family two-component response regulator